MSCISEQIQKILNDKSRNTVEMEQVISAYNLYAEAHNLPKVFNFAGWRLNKLFPRPSKLLDVMRHEGSFVDLKDSHFLYDGDSIVTFSHISDKQCTINIHDVADWLSHDNRYEKVDGLGDVMQGDDFLHSEIVRILKEKSSNSTGMADVFTAWNLYAKAHDLPTVAYLTGSSLTKHFDKISRLIAVMQDDDSNVDMKHRYYSLGRNDEIVTFNSIDDKHCPIEIDVLADWLKQHQRYLDVPVLKDIKL